MKTILFQGDSFTDCSRIRDNDAYVGHGYEGIRTDGERIEENEKV